MSQESVPGWWRAWLSMVTLSARRHARARPMMALSAGLVALTCLIIGILAHQGRFSMAHWRFPRGGKVSFPDTADQAQLAVSAASGMEPGGMAASTAVLGAFRTLVARDVRASDGRAFPGGGLYVFTRGVVFAVILSALLPLWSLAFATEAIGGPRESGELMWLLTRPVPRPMIYLAQWLAVLPWALALNVGGFAAICLSAGAPGWLALQLYWPGVAWPTLAYVSLFVFLGAVVKRPAVAALAYSFSLEMVAGNLPGPLKQASISYYARCMMMERASEYGMEVEKSTVFLPVSSTAALATLLTVTLTLLLLGMWWFSRAEYHEVD
jgi:ABC-2 type transport system permease protein